MNNSIQIKVFCNTSMLKERVDAPICLTYNVKDGSERVISTVAVRRRIAWSPNTCVLVIPLLRSELQDVRKLQSITSLVCEVDPCEPPALEKSKVLAILDVAMYINGTDWYLDSDHIRLSNKQVFGTETPMVYTIESNGVNTWFDRKLSVLPEDRLFARADGTEEKMQSTGHAVCWDTPANGIWWNEYKSSSGVLYYAVAEK